MLGVEMIQPMSEQNVVNVLPLNVKRKIVGAPSIRIGFGYFASLTIRECRVTATNRAQYVTSPVIC